MQACVLKRKPADMPGESKRKLKLATIVYWVMLVYIIAALIWWAFSLISFTEDVYRLKKEHLTLTVANTSPQFANQLFQIQDEHRRNIAKYIGEGGFFLLLIIIGAVFIYRSVRRQFNLQLQQQNFVMAITHELKTPIAIARLNLETIQRHHLDDASKTKLLQVTLQETLRLDTLINNILILSQLEAHSYKMQKEEINFSDLTADVLHQFINRYPERNIFSEITPEIEMNGDPLLLKLLISNLLENANKYSGKEKKISLRLLIETGNTILEVTDEGEGIADEEKKNVFKKFYRIGSEQTRKTQGTGLGLYLSKKIAEDHKASIILKDNQPNGSKFIVQFPT